MLGEFTWEEKPDSSLDLAGGDGGPLVVVSQSRSFSSDTFEDVVDERVHDAHGFGGNASIRVDLFEHFVDVDGKGFLPLDSPLLLVSRRSGLLDSFF